MTLVIRYLAAALLLSACSSGGLPDTPPRAAAMARLDELSAGLVAFRADDARRQALASVDAAGLTSTFGGDGLRSLQDLVRRMRERGLKLQERDARRTVVFWDAGGNEVVIQIAAEQRLLSGDLPNPTVDEHDAPVVVTPRL